MRFKRDQHLRAQADFTNVRASGFRRECGVFLFQLLDKTTTDSPPLRRVGVIASRRVGNAVVRNRCKRRLRELFRNNQDKLPKTCDLVLVSRHRTLSANYLEIETAFHQTLEKYFAWRASHS